MSRSRHIRSICALLGALLFVALPALADNSGKTKGNAAADLPKMRGKSVPKVEKTLKKKGFTKTKTSNSAAKNQTWNHPDGSEVRVHPYGNEKKSKFKSGNNAHVHKQDPQGDQLDDHGNKTTDLSESHIGVKNPKDLPTVRNRPHGAGDQ
jgi:hypothetical protein